MKRGIAMIFKTIRQSWYAQALKGLGFSFLLFVAAGIIRWIVGWGSGYKKPRKINWKKVVRRI
jgi:hypothetical protein